MDRAEQLALMESRARVAFEAARLGYFEWDLVQDRFHVSKRMAEMTGIPKGTGPAERGEILLRLAHLEDAERVRAALNRNRSCVGEFEFQFRILRPDTGSLAWLRCVAQWSSGEDRLIGAVADLTERKAEEEERAALAAEIDHRVKNILTAVQSLVAQSARKTVSLEAFLKTFAGRLEAMASAQTLLAASRWRGADIASIAAAELGALAPGQARWRGDEVLLNPRATNALTLALHELAANAVKYGALSTEAGRVDVAWRLRPEGGFDLDWREREGPGVKPPKRRGFGSVLLERVTGRELGGRAEIEFASDGVRARISADASALASSPAEGGQSGVPSRRGETGGASLGAPVGGDVDGVRVLVVEDAVLLALELEAGLAEAGAEVVGTASNLEEAQKMASLPFDVAVLDANLNGKSVLPVAEALCAQRKPFIFATGYGDDLPAPEGFGAPVVRKPYNVHQITVALAEALGRGS